MEIKNLSEKIKEEKSRHEIQLKIEAQRKIEEAERKIKVEKASREYSQKLQVKAIGAGLLAALLFCVGAFVLYIIIIFLLEIYGLFGGMSDAEYKALRPKIFYVLMIGGAIIGFVRGYWDTKENG